MKLKGARVKQLKRQNKQEVEITRRDKMMSKLKTLPEMRDFPAEDSYVPDPNIDSYKGGADEFGIEEGEITLGQSERMVTKAKARLTCLKNI